MNYKYLAKLFTSTEITRLASGDMSLLRDILYSFPQFDNLNTFEDIFETAYKLLIKHYPNEYVVKNTIANNVLIGKHSMNTASMLSELRIGSNKADCVIINGLSTCYEIKTQFDSLKRLPEQLDAYTSSFDQTYVVAHENHLKALYKYQEEFPTFGIIHANSNGNLSQKVKAPLNTSFNTELMFHTLRKGEYTHIAKEIQGYIPNVMPTELFNECKKLFCSQKEQDANELFKSTLKHYRRNDHIFINALPKSMKNLGISYKIHKTHKSNIVTCLLNNQLDNKGITNVLPIYERQTV
ncbi:hypothetical protein E5A76_07375 [Photobacterium sp. CAIM 1937]|nr:sce7726 family protein [Vibrio parahaemolyticus]MZG56254.1 hypothetical protein [Photobacterium lucens]MZG80445.1 hypothetical protein [Photobacterium lucens]